MTVSVPMKAISIILLKHVYTVTCCYSSYR